MSHFEFTFRSLNKTISFDFPDDIGKNEAYNMVHTLCCHLEFLIRTEYEVTPSPLNPIYREIDRMFREVNNENTDD